MENTIPQRLLIVANRLPCRIGEARGKLKITPSAGGLATSIATYLAKAGDSLPAIWVGAADVSEARLKPHLEEDGCLPFDAYRLLPVHLPDAMNDAFYNGFCNATIWPLFHYFPSYVHYVQAHYEAYREANALFLEKLVEVWRPGDRIWVHDYHLMLLPQLLRERLPDAEIAFFLHIPFPSFEVLRLLPDPWRRELLSGLLGADLVGFHTHAYAQHFRHSVLQVLGYDDQLGRIRTPRQVTVVDAFPISIDTERFSALHSTPQVVEERERIREQIRGRRALFSVDRLDYTKGLVQRLGAFQLFLERHPEFIGQVVYIMVVVPSRDAVDKYAELHREIEGLVGRINGRFGTIDWTPVVYRYTDISTEHMVALYSVADLALITPIRDGMNLVAKEFVASSADQRGVLILSETAGAAEELSGALLINPNDREAIASAIVQALNMTVEEQGKRHRSMIQRLRDYDVTKWAGDLLEQLNEARDGQDRMAARELRPDMEAEMAAAYARARSRVLLLDHDGTLVGFDRDPARAGPTREVLVLVAALADDPRNHVVIISGRDREELSNWYGHLPVSLGAEHGVFMRGSAGGWRCTIAEQEPWKERIRPLLNAMAERCPGSLVQEKSVSVAWHYRGAEPGLGFLRSRQLVERLHDLAGELGFRVLEGNKVVEARPRGADKGTAVASIPDLFESEFILAMGDDRTDEDMFAVLPPTAYSICIGARPSLARFNLFRQKDVLPYLRRMSVRTQPEIAHEQH